MKNTTGWTSPNTGATNSSGFAGLPGGYRNYNGTFGSVGNGGTWWSASEYATPNAWYRSLVNSSSYISRYNGNRKSGFSVRVVKD